MIQNVGLQRLNAAPSFFMPRNRMRKEKAKKTGTDDGTEKNPVGRATKYSRHWINIVVMCSVWIYLHLDTLSNTHLLRGFPLELAPGVAAKSVDVSLKGRHIGHIVHLHSRSLLQEEEEEDLQQLQLQWWMWTRFLNVLLISVADCIDINKRRRRKKMLLTK